MKGRIAGAYLLLIGMLEIRHPDLKIQLSAFTCLHHPKLHLYLFSHFCIAHSHDQQTYTQNWLGLLHAMTTKHMNQCAI